MYIKVVIGTFFTFTYNYVLAVLRGHQHLLLRVRLLTLLKL